MKRAMRFFPLAFSFWALWASNGWAQQEGKIKIENKIDRPLTLAQAVEQALVKNPELGAFSHARRVKEAEALQAGLLPNPKLGVDVENIGPSDSVETTIQLSQLIELGGKRSARKKSGALSQELSEWNYESKKLDVLAQVTKSFVDVLKDQHRLSLADEISRLEERFLLVVSERIEAGKVPRIEKTKGEVIVASSRVARERVRLDLESSRRKLALNLGELEPSFGTVVGDLYSISPIPSLKQLKANAILNPDLARWQTEQQKRQAVLDLEQARRIPDLEVKGGYRRLEATDDNALVLGLSLPLQLFNRNQGGIARARNEMLKAREERRAAELKTKNALTQAFHRLSFSHAQVTAIKKSILPGAQRAFDGVSEGYRFGKFSLLDVLDSQKTLFKSQEQYLEALADHHKAVAEVERLTAVPLQSNLQQEIQGGAR